MERMSTGPDACGTMRYGKQGEVLFIYFGHTTHPLSWSAEFVDLVDRARRIVRDAAAEAGLPLHSIGVSDDVQKGFQLLNNHKPPWDELSLGGETTNSVLVEHIWKKPPAVSTWPHVIILHRHFEISPGVVNVLSDRYLFRLLGPRELNTWVEAEPQFDFPLEL